MVGTRVTGSTLQLTPRATIGRAGQLTSIDANMPIIKEFPRPTHPTPPTLPATAVPLPLGCQQAIDRRWGYAAEK